MSTENQNTEGQRPLGFEAVKTHLLQDKIRAALWLTRGLTLIFVISYFIPILSSAERSYHKAMMCSAATSALRLHQRIPNIAFTREFLAMLVMEDSAHYLLYSMIFMYTNPITMVLVPVALFALLHFASFTQALLNLNGTNNALVSRFLIDIVEYQQRNMLRLAAFIEISLFPLIVGQVFSGYVGLVTPLFYYRFLLMRYASRRNSYTRTIFYELRLATESLIYRPMVPQFLKTFLLKCIVFLSNLAPSTPPPQ